MKDYAWQLVSLELAKKMKKLGFKQESLWWWNLQGCEDSCEYILVANQTLINNGMTGDYSAYTVAELLEDMPSHIKKGDWGLTIQKTPDVGYMVNYQNGFGECWEGWDFCNLFLANSLARMKIRLKKEGLL